MTVYEADRVRVYVRSLVPDQPIKDAVELALRGEGYATERQAEESGRRWVHAFQLGMLAEFMATDFDERGGPQGGFHPLMLDAMSSQFPGHRMYADEPGLLVIPAEPAPMFSRVRAEGTAVKNAAGIVHQTRLVHAANTILDARSLLACEMYSGSQFMPGEDSRFLMLMIAVEALIEPDLRPRNELRAIDGVLNHFESRELDSLRQTIEGLRTESIGSAGRRLAATLGDRQYDGRPAKRFFTDNYRARSALVHGNLDRPSIGTIRSLLGPLEHFVRDLVFLRNGLPLPEPLPPN